MKENIEGYEHADKRICKKGLQIESCRECLFETLCKIEDNKLDEKLLKKYERLNDYEDL